MTEQPRRDRYGTILLEHFRRPRNYGHLASPDLAADGANALCGDRLRLELALDGDTIVEARFVANACAICTAAASLLTERVTGVRLADARALTDDEAVAALGEPVAPGRRRCALLPIETLRRAVAPGDAVVGILLAGGRARRFGTQKLVAAHDGATVVRRSAERLRGALERVIVVTGADASCVRAALDGLDVAIVENAECDEGMASSIRAGVAAARPRAGAVVIALGDQPTVDPAVVTRMVAAHRSGAAIVAPRYDGVRGHPVLFGRGAFDALLRLRGDVGARALLDDDAGVAYVEVKGAAPRDVDTPADLEGLR